MLNAAEGSAAMAAGLHGTAALVTGSSGGIGEATARDLAARGAAVALVARRKDRLDTLAAQITAAGGTALALEADVTDADQAREAVEQAVRAWGRLDILINNAGAARRGPFVAAPVSDWELMVQVNLLGSLYCAHAALPHLLRAAEDKLRQVADLVNVSSLSGRIVRKEAGVYNATKHAMNAYSESLRQEVAGRRVRVSVLEPAAVATELFAAEVPRRPAQGTFRRLAPADVADAIGYVVTRPPHVAVSELLVRPAEQER
jgi:NADP-dependent 3-hydroxy acid dehydrogenase YdfG